MIEEILENTKN